MTRAVVITPAHRANLRRLKAEFDAACALVDDFSDRSSPSFQTAQGLYRTWIKAIDEAALALLDDLDALDTGAAAAGDKPKRRTYSPIDPVRPGEVEHVFAEIDDVLRARAIVGAPDDAFDR